MSGFGARAGRRVAEEWPAIRARGMRRFVLLRGVLFWGGLMLAFLAVAVTLRLGPGNPRLPLVLAVAVPLCALGGLCWGVLTWTFNERLFQALQLRNREPRA